jgi:hypothetical protein
VKIYRLLILIDDMMTQDVGCRIKNDIKKFQTQVWTPILVLGVQTQVWMKE